MRVPHQAFLWSFVLFLFKAAFWLVRAAVTLTLTAIPILGLVGLGLLAFYHPEQLAKVVRGLIAQEEESGPMGEDVPDPVV